MDRRTKRQKLEAMANQAVSPEEAKIAKEKLKSLPPDSVKQHSTIIMSFGNKIVFTISYDEW